MKKAFTLLAVAALVTMVSFAQHNQRDEEYGDKRGRDMAVNDHRGNGYERESGAYYFSSRDRDMQVLSIKKEYHRKIESVNNKWFMGRHRKEQLIYSLQMERDNEIRAVFAKFNDRGSRFNDQEGRHNRHDRNGW